MHRHRSGRRVRPVVDVPRTGRRVERVFHDVELVCRVGVEFVAFGGTDSQSVPSGEARLVHVGRLGFAGHAGRELGRRSLGVAALACLELEALYQRPARHALYKPAAFGVHYERQLQVSHLTWLDRRFDVAGLSETQNKQDALRVWSCARRVFGCVCRLVDGCACHHE